MVLLSTKDKGVRVVEYRSGCGRSRCRFPVVYLHTEQFVNGLWLDELVQPHRENPGVTEHYVSRCRAVTLNIRNAMVQLAPFYGPSMKRRPPYCTVEQRSHVFGPKTS